MTRALDEFVIRLEDIRANLEFVSASSKLRPKLNDMLRREAIGAEIALATDFIECKNSRPESMYAGLVVKCASALERYSRSLVAFAIEHINSRAKSLDEVPANILAKNIIFTGRALASSENPRDYLNFDYVGLAKKLATCRTGSESFELNATVFSASIPDSSPTSLQHAFESIGIGDLWDSVGQHQPLQRYFDQGGARATGKRSFEEVRAISRRRNRVAHGGDDDLVVSEEEITSTLDFLSHFVAALDSVAEQALGTSKRPSPKVGKRG